MTIRTKDEDLIEQTNSLIASLCYNYNNIGESFTIKIIECLFEKLEPEKVYQIVNCAAEHLKSVEPLENIPVFQNDEIVLLPVNELISVVAEGRNLHLTTIKNEHFTINFRLKDLQLRLNFSKFISLTRGSLVNLDFVSSIKPISGGTYLITMANGQQLPVSRIQSRILRERLLRL